MESGSTVNRGDPYVFVCYILVLVVFVLALVEYFLSLCIWKATSECIVISMMIPLSCSINLKIFL